MVTDPYSPCVSKEFCMAIRIVALVYTYILALAYTYSCFSQPPLVHCSYNFKSPTSIVIYSTDFLCVCVTDPALLSCTRHKDFCITILL